MPSYATIVEAQTYFDRVLNTRPWDCASATEKTTALAQATDIIDRLNFLGCKTVDTQPNQFPRKPDTLIPDDIKNASAAIALALLDGVDPELEYENLHLKSQGYGSVRATYDQTPPQPHAVGGIPSVTAWRFLRPYLRDPNTMDLFRTS
jgi:hypothetical protein